MTNPEHQARSIFLNLIEQPVADREQLIAAACGGDHDLRTRIERLLRSHDELGSFHEHPTAVATIDFAALESPGAQIGHYKLLQKIGEGGMGTVYMAEQTAPVQRKVALKVIKPGMDSQQVIARFEAERQALSMMDHVNIARVLDAGTTEQGRPYFVMELVHGVPITKYCDDNGLTPRQRLELFVPVCQAIQHAHQKGIIHRDIKPSNVMITLYDGRPVPKVIDFGVAKAIEQKLTDRTLFTHYGMMVGTLEYMSPEQAEMNALGVDTRSDVYSLGVLLYELLTGSTPLSGKQLRQAAQAEIVRMIREDEPPKPSTRLSESGEALASISAQRRTQPARLSKLMRGELDWIVMRTLEKDRNRRYESASSFAADLQRYLNNEPVEASPPSSWYRARKYLRRHRGPLATAAVVASALIAGTGVSSWLAYEANQARVAADNDRVAADEARLASDRDRRLADQRFQEAESERKRADASYEKARETVKKLLAQVATDEVVRIPGMREVYLKLIDEAIASYDELLVLKPADAGIYLDQGALLLVKGSISAAQEKFQRAVDLAPDDPRAHFLLAQSLVTMTVATIETMIIFHQKKGVQYYIDKAPTPEDKVVLATALKHVERAIELTKDQELPAKLLRVKILYWLDRGDEARQELSQVEQRGPFTVAQQVDLAEVSNGLKEHKKAIQYAEQALAGDPANHLAYFRLGESQLLLGRNVEAVAAISESLRLDPQENHRKRLNKLQMRGDASIVLGKHAEAIADFDEVLAADPQRWIVYKRRALAEFQLGRFTEALADVKRGFELKPDDTSTLSWISPSLVVRCPDAAFVAGMFALCAKTKGKLSALHEERANHRLDGGDVDGALEDVLKAMEITPDAVRLGNCDAVKDLLKRGERYREQLLPIRNRYLDHLAKELIEVKTLLDEQLATLGNQSLETRETMNRLTKLRFQQMVRLMEEHRYAEAEPVMLDDLADARRVWGDSHIDTFSPQINLVAIYSKLGRQDQCLALGKTLHDSARRELGSEHLVTLISLGNVAQGLLEQGDHAEAEPLLKEAVETCRRVRGETDGYTLTNANRLGFVLREQGKYADAETLFLAQLELCQRSLGKESTWAVSALEGLMLTYETMQQYAKMEVLAREFYEIQQRRKPDDVGFFEAHSALGASLLGQGKLDEAAPLLLSGYQGMKQRAKPSWFFWRGETLAVARLTKLYEAKNDFEELVRWQYEAEVVRKCWPPRN